MSFGMFEAQVSSDQEKQLQQREAAAKLDAAVYDVRERFGSFLFAAKDIQEYHDRLALCKNDVIKTASQHVFPRTGVLRRVLKPIEREFKARLAASPESFYPQYHPGGENEATPAPHRQAPQGRHESNDEWSGEGGHASGELLHAPGHVTVMQHVPGAPGDPRHLGYRLATEDKDEHGFESNSTITNKQKDGIAEKDQEKVHDVDTNSGDGTNASGDNPKKNVGIHGSRRHAVEPAIGPFTDPGAGFTHDYLDQNYGEDVGGGVRSLPTTMEGSRRQADRAEVHTEITYKPSKGDLKPKGDFAAYLESVSQGAAEKGRHNFEKASCARFASWCVAARTRPTLGALDAYNPSDAEYLVIAAALTRQATDGPADPMGGFTPYDGAAMSRIEQGSPAMSAWADNAPIKEGYLKWCQRTGSRPTQEGLQRFAAHVAAEGQPSTSVDWSANVESGGQPVFTDPSSAAAGLQALGNRHQAYDELGTGYVGLDNSAPVTYDEAPRKKPRRPANEQWPDQQRVKQAIAAPFFGGDPDGIREEYDGGDDSPEMAFLDDYHGHGVKPGKDKPNPQHARGDEGPGGYYANRRQAEGNGFDAFGSGDGFTPFNGGTGWDAYGRDDHPAAPGMSQGIGDGLSKSAASGNHLQKADQALTDLLNQKAEEFQNTIAPLQQALMTVQQAEQAEQAQNPLNVVPGGQGINVLPQAQQGVQPPGMDASGVAAATAPPDAGQGAPPPAAGAQDALPPDLQQQQLQANRRQATDPNKWERVPNAGYPLNREDANRGYDWLEEHGGGPRERHLEGPFDDDLKGRSNSQEHPRGRDAKRGGQGKGEARSAGSRQADVVGDWNSWVSGQSAKGALPSGLPNGSESDIEQFTQQKGVGPRAQKKLREQVMGGGQQLASKTACWPGCHENEEHSRKFHKEKEAGLGDTLHKVKDWGMSDPGGNIYDSKPGNWVDHKKNQLHDLGQDLDRRHDDWAEGEAAHGGWRGKTFGESPDDRQHDLEERGRFAKRKHAWFGWGPDPRHRKVAGWDWDSHLAAYVTSSVDKFACDCGEEHDTPSFHRCKCGKNWNSYVIGHDGEGRQASLEKVLCREIPVRRDVIVASKHEAVQSDNPWDHGSYWHKKGYEAYYSDQPRAPMAHPEFHEFVKSEPSRASFLSAGRAYTDGFDRAANEAARRALEASKQHDDSPREDYQDNDDHVDWDGSFHHQAAGYLTQDQMGTFDDLALGHGADPRRRSAPRAQLSEDQEAASHPADAAKYMGPQHWAGKYDDAAFYSTPSDEAFQEYDSKDQTAPFDEPVNVDRAHPKGRATPADWHRRDRDNRWAKRVRIDNPEDFEGTDDDAVPELKKTPKDWHKRDQNQRWTK